MKSYKEELIEKMKTSNTAHIVEGEELLRLQKVLFNIYKDVEAVCKKHHLTCMLIGGSALGAIRHKGFIPWDDDLDMAMPRKDYEIFKDIFVNELGEKYVLNSPNYSNKPTNRFPKVLKRNTKFVEVDSIDDDRACIKIDIFIIENVPNNIFKRLIKGLRCTAYMFAGGHVLSYEESMEQHKKMHKRELIGKMLSFWSSTKWFNRFDKVCRYNDEESEFVGIPSGRNHYFREIVSREVLLPVVQGAFEGEKVFLPADADAYLRNLYGDYMMIPPEEKREKHYIEKIEF